MARTHPGIGVISLLLLRFVIGSQAVSLLDTDSQAHTQLGDTEWPRDLSYSFWFHMLPAQTWGQYSGLRHGTA